MTSPLKYKPFLYRPCDPGGGSAAHHVHGHVFHVVRKRRPPSAAPCKSAGSGYSQIHCFSHAVPCFSSQLNPSSANARHENIKESTLWVSHSDVTGTDTEKQQLNEAKERQGEMFEAKGLVSMYVKCGRVVDARHVFDSMPKHDVVSWNVMIQGYAKKEGGEMEALELYARMQQEGVQANERTFAGVLGACRSLAALEEGTEVDGKAVKLMCLEKVRAIHSQVVKAGFDSQVLLGNTMIDAYSKCGSMVDAQLVFERLAHRDVVSWNSMIMGYCNKAQGELELALQLYARMQQEGFTPNSRTFVGALKACSGLASVQGEVEGVGGKLVKMQCLERGRAIHSQVLKHGFQSNAFVGNTLIDMYAKCGSMVDARHVFHNLPRRDVVSWTAMIVGHADNQEPDMALQLYEQMLQQHGIPPNDRTFVGTLRACGNLATLDGGSQVDPNFVKVRCLRIGRAIHSQIVKSGLDAFLGNALVDMYAKCGSIEDARHIFDKLQHRDVISWNTMILGYAEEQEGELALQLFEEMQQQGVAPNDRTFVGALKACGILGAFEVGKQVDGSFVKIRGLEKGRAVHSQVVNTGFESELYVGTALVQMYAKCGSMVDARSVFDKMPHRDLVSWNATILGYADDGESEAALKLYRQMLEQQLQPDSNTFVGILKACGNTSALETGKDVHARIRRLGLESSAIVATALIDMYGKCGSIADARQVFEALATRDVVTWSALIAGCARQGDSTLVFHLFERMRQEGVQPDAVTFLSLLSVCSHVGLVDKGRDYFQAMSKDYAVPPTIQHYACMVDLLGRAGQVDEAMAMVETMPFQPNLVVWMTMLGACRKWNTVEVGKQAYQRAVGLDDKHAAAYVLMSNIYADAGMLEDRDMIQMMRKKACAWKKPGQSWWTDVTGIVHTFVAGDTKHPHSTGIYAKLESVYVKMSKEGYIPHLDSVFGDMYDQEKEDAVCGHSEKLAIACALLKTPPETPIRIVKNLRVCDDCHIFIACVSKMEHRNIICRDGSRFHDFKDGKCSCGDYW